MGEGQAEIRVAQVSDVPDIQRVARGTWAVAYAGMIPEEIRRRLLDAWYSEAALTRALGTPDSTFLVAEATGTVVGFAQYVRQSTEVAELTRIYVLPEHQHEGIGTQLLEVGLAACRQQGVNRLTVLVERENATGHDFYRARGFAEVAERRQEVQGYVLELVECNRPISSVR